jgi:hypothetical protein
MRQNNTKKYLLGGTQLSSVMEQIFGRVSSSKRGSGHIDRGRQAAAFGVSLTIDCPVLTDDIIQELDANPPETITRHIEAQYLKPAQDGAFYFGTIASYAPKDTALTAGRLGDGQEGTQRDVFNTRSGFFKNAKFGGLELSNVAVEGMDAVAVEYTVNDYCSCSSLGDFDEDRAGSLRNQGNPTLDSYVTYDVAKLKAALQDILDEQLERKLRLFGREVIYGKKDREWEIEQRYAHVEERDPLAIYLGITTVKSPNYKHEDEYRMLLVDPEKLGILPPDTPYLFLKDSRIADTIVASGSF